MKKLIIIVFAIFVSVCVFAQTKQHMKFMGVPMGISINSFQQKLEAKGIKYDQFASKHFSADAKKFDGTFAGYQASIYTYYDTKDYNVYRAKAMIERNNLEQSEQIFNDILNMLKQKYPDSFSIDTSNDYKGTSIYTNLGRIDCYISRVKGDLANLYKDRYYVSVDYWDSKTVNQHENNRMDDL